MTGSRLETPMLEDGQLETPALLLAMPQIMDPYFRQSVVLLLAHEQEGSLGFVVNRPSNLKVAQILADLEVEWLGDPEAPAYVGGPVRPQLGTLLVADEGAPGGHSDTLAAIAPGIAITQSLELLSQLAQQPETTMRFLLGYAGWGEGQLIGEIRRHDWLVAPVAAQLVFTEDPDEAWRGALGSVGIDAASLPSWTDGDQKAN